MVFKRYVEQLPLDGKGQAYPRKIGLIPDEKLRRAFQIFKKDRHVTYLCCHYQSVPRELVTCTAIFSPVNVAHTQPCSRGFELESCEGIALGTRLGLHFLFQRQSNCFHLESCRSFSSRSPHTIKHREEH